MVNPGTGFSYPTLLLALEEVERLADPTQSCTFKQIPIIERRKWWQPMFFEAENNVDVDGRLRSVAEAVVAAKTVVRHSSWFCSN